VAWFADENANANLRRTSPVGNYESEGRFSLRGTAQ